MYAVEFLHTTFEDVNIYAGDISTKSYYLSHKNHLHCFIKMFLSLHRDIFHEKVNNLQITLCRKL